MRTSCQAKHLLLALGAVLGAGACNLDPEYYLVSNRAVQASARLPLGKGDLPGHRITMSETELPEAAVASAASIPRREEALITLPEGHFVVKRSDLARARERTGPAKVPARAVVLDVPSSVRRDSIADWAPFDQDRVFVRSNGIGKRTRGAFLLSGVLVTVAGTALIVGGSFMVNQASQIGQMCTPMTLANLFCGLTELYEGAAGGGLLSLGVGSVASGIALLAIGATRHVSEGDLPEAPDDIAATPIDGAMPSGPTGGLAPPREACEQYIRLHNIKYPLFIATYGRDGSCWQADQSRADNCARQCARMLAE